MEEIELLKTELNEKNEQLQESQVIIARAWRERKQARDAHRIAAVRLKKKNKAVTAARCDERNKMHDLIKSKTHNMNETFRNRRHELQERVRESKNEQKAVGS